MADRNPDGRRLAQQILAENRLINNLYCVEDGKELMDYVYHRGKYKQAKNSPWPDLILLDLDILKQDEYQTLKQIKADPNLRQIPMVVLTTSERKEDINLPYDLDVTSFITRPVTFEALIEAITISGKFWVEIVELL
jgi:CheY-like chemotaxis protein